MSDSCQMWKIIKKQHDPATLGLSLQSRRQYVQTDDTDLSMYQVCSFEVCGDGQDNSHLDVRFVFQDGINRRPGAIHLLTSPSLQKLSSELTIDDMMAALVDHDKRSQYLEDTAVKFPRSNHEASVRGKLLAPQNRKRRTGPCDHCGSKFHGKENCYYFHPNMRQTGWRPMQGKGHLMKNNKGGGAKAVCSSNENGIFGSNIRKRLVSGLSCRSPYYLRPFRLRNVVYEPLPPSRGLQMILHFLLLEKVPF